MRVIISPAKKMTEDRETLPCAELPVFLEDADKIRGWIRERSFPEMQKIWGCNDKLAEENMIRIREMELTRNLTPALLAYNGIQYQYMAPAVLEDNQYTYLQDHLRILSGFYGVLRPMDGVAPYRLEMQAKMVTEETDLYGSRTLYDFWGSRLYEEVMDDSRIVFNLASKEYSKCIEKYLRPGDRFITCIFGEMEKGKVVQKGVYAKMARGEMVRYLAENQIEDPEEAKNFQGLGYVFNPEQSKENTWVYLKTV